MCKNRSEENKVRYENNKYRTKKVTANFTRKEPEKELTKLDEKPNNIDTGEVHEKRWKNIEGGR